MLNYHLRTKPTNKLNPRIFKTPLVTSSLQRSLYHPIIPLPHHPITPSITLSHHYPTTSSYHRLLHHSITYTITPSLTHHSYHHPITSSITLSHHHTTTPLPHHSIITFITSSLHHLHHHSITNTSLIPLPHHSIDHSITPSHHHSIKMTSYDDDDNKSSLLKQVLN